jgi:hypothetical protein
VPICCDPNEICAPLNGEPDCLPRLLPTA